MKSKWTKKSDACSAMLNLKRRKLKILTWLWCTKNKISATAANALFVKFVSLRSLCCKNILQQRTKINGKNNTNSFYVICLQNCVNMYIKSISSSFFSHQIERSKTKKTYSRTDSSVIN